MYSFYANEGMSVDECWVHLEGGELVIEFFDYDDLDESGEPATTVWELTSEDEAGIHFRGGCLASGGYGELFFSVEDDSFVGSWSEHMEQGLWRIQLLEEEEEDDDDGEESAPDSQ